MIDLKSVFRINMINLSPLFDEKETREEGAEKSTQVYEAVATPIPKAGGKGKKTRGYDAVSAKDFESLNSYTVEAPQVKIEPKSADSVTVKEVESPLKTSDSESEQTTLLSALVEEGKKQTKLLEKSVDPTDVVKSEKVKEIKEDNKTSSHFDRLNNTIADSQKDSTEAITNQIDHMEETLNKNLATMPLMGGSGDIIDDITEDIDIDGDRSKKKTKTRTKKPPKAPKGGKKNVIKRVASKVGGGAKKVLGAGGKSVQALLPEALMAGGTGATLTGGAGAAFTGGVASAATAGAAVLAAGAAGYGVGTLINKGMEKVTGRDDWLFGWLGDKKEAAAQEKQRKESYAKFSKICSDDVLSMLGGERDFDPTGFLGLRSKGLIIYRGDTWFTKSEADMQQVNDVNAMIKRVEDQTTPLPAHLIDTKPSDITDADKAKLEALSKRQETMLADFNKSILSDVVGAGKEAQVKRFLDAYKQSEEAYRSAKGSERERIKEEMERSEAIIQELSGKSRIEVEELYKQNVAKIVNAEMEKIVPTITPTTPPEVPTAANRLAEQGGAGIVEIDINEKYRKALESSKTERAEGIQTEINVLEEKKKEAKGFLNIRKINQEIDDLEKQKEEIENMSGSEYKTWLKDAIAVSKRRISAMEKKKNSMWTMMSPAQIESDISESQLQLDIYASEIRRMDAILKRKSIPANTAIPEAETTAPPAANKLVNQTKEIERARVAEARALEERKKEKPPQVVVQQAPAPSPPPQTTPTRTTRIDDAGVELMRTLISG